MFKHLSRTSFSHGASYQLINMRPLTFQRTHLLLSTMQPSIVIMSASSLHTLARSPSSSSSYHNASIIRPSLSSYHASSSTLLLSPSYNNGSSRRSFAYTNRIPPFYLNLAASEHAANIAPHDPYYQAAYLKRLGAVDPQAVIQRVESGQYAYNKDVIAEYEKARQYLGIDPPPPETNPNNAPYSSTAVRQATPSSSGNTTTTTTTTVPFNPNTPLHVVVDADNRGRSFFARLINLGVGVLMIGILYSVYTTSSQAGGLIGKGNIKEWKNDGDVPKVSFDDVKGCDEAKSELEEIVEYLRHPAHFEKLGGKMVKGILLTGPPGTGKTLLAKAIAGEAHVPFFSCSGSDFEEMFVGVGARRIRELFSNARKKAPCIIFIDEIDAVGSKRSGRDVQAARLSLNQLLVEMDGFDKTNGVIVIGATNLPGLLDSALTRPGRFDRHIAVPLPDVRGRKQILDLYAAKIPLAADVNTEILARGTSGCTGAQLFNLMNSAALRASSKGLAAVTMKELEYAKDKILMGAERANVMTLAEKTMTAYHEGGHALVALHTPHTIPLYKATILPRGQSLGTTHFLPDSDMHSQSKAQLIARVDVAMGGRVAEELIFGVDSITTGASSDLDTATKIVRAMITQYGMSDTVGLMTIPEDDPNSYNATTATSLLSQEKKHLIDNEMNHLLNTSYQRAKNILSTHMTSLHRLAAALLKYETLDVNEIKHILSSSSTEELLVPTDQQLNKLIQQREKETTNSPPPENQSTPKGTGVKIPTGLPPTVPAGSPVPT